MSERKLKPGWRWVKFGDVVQLFRETCRDARAQGIERVVGLEHIDPDDLRIRSWASINDGTTFTQRFRSGQVLFGRRRAYQRKVALADFDGICSGDIYVLQARGELSPDVLPFICQSEAFLQHAIGHAAGSLSPRTKWESVAEFEFALPPAAQQASLALVLSGAREALDAQVALLASTRRLLRSAMQALAIPAGTSFSKTGDVEQVPHEWKALTIRQLCRNRSDLVLGPFGSNLLTSDFEGLTEGVPVVFVRDIRPNRFQYTSQCFVRPEKARALAAHHALPGDVLIAKVGVPESRGIPPGLTCVVPPDFPECVITADVIRVRTDPAIVFPPYLGIALNCEWGRAQTQRMAPGSTNRYKMNLADFGELRIPVPTIEYQERAWSAISGILDAETQTLARITQLRGVSAAFISQQFLVP